MAQTADEILDNLASYIQRIPKRDTRKRAEGPTDGEDAPSGGCGAWPALAFYLAAWPPALTGEWTAVWLFVFSGSVLAVTLYSAPRAKMSLKHQASHPDAWRPIRQLR